MTPSPDPIRTATPLSAAEPLTAEEEETFRRSLAPSAQQNPIGRMYLCLLATLDAARQPVVDGVLDEWVATVRAKFRLPDPTAGEKDYWTGYEAALADVERFARGSR